MKDISHSFSVNIAKEHGVNSAILLQHIVFWYLKNKSDKINFFHRDYWVRMSVKQLGGYFIYFNQRQIGYALKKLEEKKLIKSKEFNVKKSDRTKWYTLTKKGKEITGLNVNYKIVNNNDLDGVQTTENKGVTGFDKNVNYKIVNNNENAPENQGDVSGEEVDKIVKPVDNFVNTLYKEVDIKSIYTITTILEQKVDLIEVIAMKNKLKIETVKYQISEFSKYVIATSQVYNNRNELYKHFMNWIPKQDLSENDCDKNLDWFLKRFNSISRKQFVKTSSIKKLFQKQLDNGFSGDQMVLAVKNLYSSDVRNDFHLKSAFKFATPDYLLKEGNLNKYLNLNY